jgi:hypothetical protein
MNGWMGWVDGMDGWMNNLLVRQHVPFESELRTCNSIWRTVTRVAYLWTCTCLHQRNRVREVQSILTTAQALLRAGNRYES